MTITTKVARAAGWLAIGRWLQMIMSIVSLAVIARYVGPEAFGLFALCMVMAQVFDALVPETAIETLVQREDPKPGHFDAMFYCTQLIGCLTAAAIILWIDGFVWLLGHEDVAGPLILLAATMPLRALVSAPNATMQRELRIAHLTAVDSVAIGVAAVVGIVLAILGAGIWTLAIMEAVRAVLKLIGSYYCASWRPGLQGRWSHMAELFKFAITVVGIRAVGLVELAGTRLLIGTMLGATALGYFMLAYKFYEQIRGVLVDPLGGMALPAAARLQNDHETLNRMLDAGGRLATLISYPAFLGLAAISPLAIPLIFGPDWVPAVAVVQVMMLLGLRIAVEAFNSGVIRGLGRPDLFLKVNLFGNLLALALAYLLVPYGVVAVTAGLVVRQFLTWPITAYMVQTLTGFSMWEQLRTARLGALAGVLMTGGVVLFLWLVQGHWNDFVVLGSAIKLGAVLYICITLVVAPSSVQQARELIRQVRGGAQPVAG